MTDEQIAEAMGWDVRHLRLSADSVAHRVCNLVAEAERGRWQPMATAPKDGKSMLLFDGSKNGGVFVGHEATFPLKPWVTAGAFPIHPTHWMLLPEPPNDKDERAAQPSAPLQG